LTGSREGEVIVMKLDFGTYSDHMYLVFYLLLAASTPLLAAFLIGHLNPIAL